MASEFALRYALHQIRHGGIIAYPTETVYGLGCDPMNSEAVLSLNALKNRGKNKGLILIGSSLEQFSKFIDVPEKKDRDKIQNSKTPTSWIVPSSHQAPVWLTGNRKTLAIRVSKHEIVTRLCTGLGSPIVSTSANPGGHKPANSALDLHRYFQNKIDAFIFSNDYQPGQPSTIRSLHNDKIIRP